MSRTIRIYNNPNLKKIPRAHMDNGEYVRKGIPITRRSWICMGRCPVCRDSKKEPRVLRKKRLEEFRFQLKHELEMIKL